MDALTAEVFPPASTEWRVIVLEALAVSTRDIWTGWRRAFFEREFGFESVCFHSVVWRMKTAEQRLALLQEAVCAERLPTGASEVLRQLVDAAGSDDELMVLTREQRQTLSFEERETLTRVEAKKSSEVASLLWSVAAAAAAGMMVYTNWALVQATTTADQIRSD